MCAMINCFMEVLGCTNLIFLLFIWRWWEIRSGTDMNIFYYLHGYRCPCEADLSIDYGQAAYYSIFLNSAFAMV